MTSFDVGPEQSDSFGDAARTSLPEVPERLRQTELPERPAHGGQPRQGEQPGQHVEPDWHTAHRLAYECAQPLPIETVDLAEAAGRALAEDVASLVDLPTFDSSAMDGWAVAGRGPWHLAGQVLAGELHPAPLAPGTCVEIATGAIVPEGADGVLRSENGQLDGGVLSRGPSARPDEPRPAEHVRPAGAEAGRGEILLTRGTLLNPAQIGLAAAVGLDQVAVRRQPRIDVLVLGDELLRSGTPEPGQVRDALGPALPALIRAFGAVPGRLRFVPDTLQATTDAIGGCDGDVIWTTGGTAHGPVDHIHPALGVLGARVIVDSVAMRPGHPLTFAQLPAGSGRDRLLVALPGNPLSAIVGTLTAGWPMVRALLGLPPLDFGEAKAEAAIKTNGRDTRLVPVTLTAGVARERRWLVSAMLRGLAGADAIAIVPPAGVGAGKPVQLLNLPW